MSQENNVSAQAAKLHDVLTAMGYTTDHSQCVDVVAEIEKHEHQEKHMSLISDTQRIAEQYINDVIEGFMEENYKKSTQYTEEKYLVNSTEREFKRDVRNTREELGAYLHREFLGSLSAETHPENADLYPDHIRYVWRGIFEKNEGLLILGMYCKDGVYYASDISCK